MNNDLTCIDNFAHPFTLYDWQVNGSIQSYGVDIIQLDNFNIFSETPMEKAIEVFGEQWRDLKQDFLR